MNLILRRSPAEADGVFGVLTDEAGNQIAVTLEHAFDSGNGDGSYEPKVAEGTYVCSRHAPNRLPYETFELQNVPPFQGKPVNGILIHIGNYNSDSDGCILVGDERNGEMIMNSKITFVKLMNLQNDVDQFTLTVTS